MISQKVNVNLQADTEARPVAMLVQIASQFDSRIFLIEGSKKINAKSIMGMMSLSLSQGTELMIECEGTDEEQALAEMSKYIESIN